MYILCDTCSVLMLIRVAPNMFCDNRYGCVTMQEVIRELFRTQKFKTKYPWRARYKNKIKALGIINDWMEKSFIKWNDDFQAVIEDWDKCNERPQPKKEVRRFEKLSGYKYAGPK